jgi:CRISPR-associated protein Csm4
MTTKTFSLIRLKFHSPLHLSKGKADYDSSSEVLHSDTIKSAIFVAALSLYGEKITEKQTNTSNDFLDSFSVSSAFPYYNVNKEGKDNFRYFFPKALTAKINIAGKDELKNRKQAKKIKWLDHEHFEQMLNNQLSAVAEKTVAGAYLSKIFEHIEKPVLIQSEVVRRVTIPRDGSDAKPFYMDRLFFGENAGMFFLIDFHNENYKTEILNALTLLGENGFGTDRNVGNGNFSAEYIKDAITFATNPTATMQMNLSLYCPEEQEFPQIIREDDTRTAYSLIKRGGWVANPQEDKHRTLRKKSIYMFAEGSVFNVAPTSLALKGKLVDLQPQDNAVFTQPHPIWRDGRAIFVPMIYPQQTS